MEIQQYVRRSNYDSILSDRGRELELRIVVVAVLDPVVPNGGHIRSVKDGEDHEFLAVKWHPAEWARWKNALLTRVNRGWSNKFWLVPEMGFVTDHRELKPLKSVRCTFELIVGDASAGSHHARIKCYNLHKPDQEFTSYVDRERRTIHLDNDDAQYRSERVCTALSMSMDEEPQITSVHEIGHFLGLDHVADGAAYEYGANAEECADVMGAGNVFNTWHARPWLERIREHIRDMAIAWRVAVLPDIEEGSSVDYPRQRRWCRAVGACDPEIGY